MAKLSISLALVVAQVVTWATASLYTCISADGTACIDRGPEFCECCHDGLEGDSHHHSNLAQACDDHGAKADDCAVAASCSSAPCGCRHQSMGDALKAAPIAK